MLFGTTSDQAAEAAENLYDEANAVEGVEMRKEGWQNPLPASMKVINYQEKMELVQAVEHRQQEQSLRF